MRLDSHMCRDTHCGLQSYDTVLLMTVNANIREEYTVPSLPPTPLRWDSMFFRNVDTHLAGYYTDKMSRSVVIT